MKNEELKKMALDFLRQQKTAFVATASNQGEPQVAMLYCAVDDDFSFNFVTTAKSKKFQNIKNNSHIAIAVGSAQDLMTIQCGGYAEIINYSDKELKRGGEIIKKVMGQADLKNSPEWPILLTFPPPELGVFVVKPQWMVLLNLNFKKGLQFYKHDYQIVLP